MAGLVISGERKVQVERLREGAARAATGFARLGIGPGDAVALMLRNEPAFLEASLATVQLGAFAVPINWHNKQEEVQYILQDCGAKALVTHADLLPQIPADAGTRLKLLVAETPPEVRSAYHVGEDAARARPDAPAGAEDWARWRDGFAPRTDPPLPHRASMIYTSGTTGRPKGVRRGMETDATLLHRRRAAQEVFGIEPGIRTVITGPMYHSAPNAFALLSLAFEAELVVLQPRFDAEELLALIERHKLTHMHMVPTMFVRLLRLPPEVQRRYDLSSLRWVIHAAAPCPPDIKRAMIEWWGPVINEYYGSTEVGTVTFCTSHDWLAHPGTVGRTTSFCRLRVLDEQGRPTTTGQPGLLYAQNFGASDFTYQNNDAKRREIDREGYITNGDIGYLDDQSYLFLCDRQSDMVISGGVNIYPAEIEATLLSHPSVQDCAVFGIPDPEYGEALAAAVQRRPGATLTAEDVQAHVRAHLSDYKVPKVVEFLSTLPREDSGKIFKRHLRDPYWAGTGRKI